ncbi:MAG: hypothetical protein P8M71_03410 [Pseudomonadales bacterium]|jgi:hypothetical protein|nr:hypothetical protein [Pseudomonadales bacterium]
MDPLNSVLMFFGFTLLIASWIQMIVTASQEDFTWGLFSFFLPPLAYLYALTQWDKASDSIKMAIGGLALLFFAFS